MSHPISRWSDNAYEAFRAHSIAQVPYLPDGGLSPLIARCTDDPTMRATPLTTEEEGVMQLTGAWLGGQRSALLMQCGGVGNCVNAFSLLVATATPCVMVVTMRGVWGEFNPWQVPMGQATRGCFELFDFTIMDLEREEEAAATFDAAFKIAYGAGRRVVVLVQQKMLGAKDFRK